MAMTDIYNTSKEKVGEIDLQDSIFGVDVNSHLLHDVVRMQLAKRRQGTACTKTRAEVRGSSAKPYRQKGTGRARAGNRRSPVWRGGGTVFGPKPRDYGFKLSKKVRKLGLRMALSSRNSADNILIIDEFQLEEIKTRKFVDVMDKLEIDNCLIVVPEHDDKLERSSRNVPGYKVLPVAGINVYDILLHKKLIIVQPSLDKIAERLQP
jgi:large subunit ribosomal protein L4